MDIEVPHLPYGRLRTVADEFLRRHHPGGYLPIPIENIVEFDFNLDIVSMPGLKDTFDVDAFITSDRTEIRVDEFIYRKRPNRYRYSLAHELAHLLIHGDVFKALAFSSIQEWKQVMCSIPTDKYGWIENQAYALAGLMLVPTASLAAIFQDKAEEARLAGVDIYDVDPQSRKIVASNIGKHFEVSGEVVTRRLVKDGHWKAT